MRPDHAARAITLTNRHREQVLFIFNFGLKNAKGYTHV